MEYCTRCEKLTSVSATRYKYKGGFMSEVHYCNECSFPVSTKNVSSFKKKQPIKGGDKNEK